MEHVYMDMLEPESQLGNKHIFLMVHEFIRWGEIYVVSDQTAHPEQILLWINSLHGVGVHCKSTVTFRNISI